MMFLNILCWQSYDLCEHCDYSCVNYFSYDINHRTTLISFCKVVKRFMKAQNVVYLSAIFDIGYVLYTFCSDMNICSIMASKSEVQNCKRMNSFEISQLKSIYSTF